MSINDLKRVAKDLGALDKIPFNDLVAMESSVTSQKYSSHRDNDQQRARLIKKWLNEHAMKAVAEKQAKDEGERNSFIREKIDEDVMQKQKQTGHSTASKGLLFSQLIAALLLLFALGDYPYIYYQILRWVVTGVAAYSAYLAYSNSKYIWTWLLGLLAFLFNPILPFYLNKDIWMLIDIVTAIVILVSIFTFRKDGLVRRNGS